MAAIRAGWIFPLLFSDGLLKQTCLPKKMLRALPQGVRTLLLSFLFEMFLDRLIERIIFVTRFLQWNNAVPLLPLYKLVLPRHWEHAECPYRI